MLKLTTVYLSDLKRVSSYLADFQTKIDENELAAWRKLKGVCSGLLGEDKQNQYDV